MNIMKVKCIKNDIQGIYFKDEEYDIVTTYCGDVYTKKKINGVDLVIETGITRETLSSDWFKKHFEIISNIDTLAKNGKTSPYATLKSIEKEVFYLTI